MCTRDGVHIRFSGAGGCILVFVPSLGSFLAPDLLGGAKNFMIGSLIEEQFKGVNLAIKARRSTELDSEGRPLTSVLGGKNQMHARIAVGTGKMVIPRVVVINQWPFRFKIQKGFVKDHCNKCHQDPCECDAVQAELERTLAFKAGAREKQKARAQANKNKAGPSGYGNR